MTPRSIAPIVVGALLCASLAAGAEDLQAVTKQYCVSCHNTDDWAGELALDSIDYAHIPSEAQTGRRCWSNCAPA